MRIGRLEAKVSVTPTWWLGYQCYRQIGSGYYALDLFVVPPFAIILRWHWFTPPNRNR